MRFPLALSAAAIVAIAIAACSGSQPSTYVSPPTGTVAAAGALVLTGASQTQSIGTASGMTGTLTYVGGTGAVTASSSATAPAGTTTVTPADRVRVEASSSPTSPNVYYVSISSTAGALLSGLPAVSLVLTTPPIGTYQEAQWTGTTWANVSGATSIVNSAMTVVDFPAGKSPVTIAAGGALYLAFYQGNFPQPTPTPVATPTQVLADPSFESGTAAAYGAAIGSTGWTQCSISALSPSAPAGTSPIHPLSTFTPTPATTPGAVIALGGSSILQGTATPVPTQSTVPLDGVDGTHAAVLGGVFSTFNQANFAYDGLCQAVTIPRQQANMVMQIFGNGNEAAAFVDFDVILLDTSGGYLTDLYDEQVVTATSPGDTAYRQVTVANSALQPFAGKAVQVFVGIWTKSGSGSNSLKFSGYYFIDSFFLNGVP